MKKAVIEIEMNKMLKDDNGRMREAGCNLAEAAIRVIRDYDGIHRLSLAVSEWMKVIGDEGNRTKDNDNVIYVKPNEKK